jgi:diguanylate cyclase (GGDEF)-like protein
MPEVFLIGNEVRAYGDILSEGGFGVRNFRSARAAIKKLPDAHLLVIDRDFRDSARELSRASRTVPKIIISRASTARKLGTWLKEPLTHVLHEPSDRELLNYVHRILKESERIRENEALKKSVRTMKKEVAFFEQINKALTSSLDINEILVMVMKKVSKIASAQAWSILLKDESTGELVFEKTVGKANREIKRMRIVPGEGIAGWVAQHGVPALVPDVRKDKRFSPKIDRYSDFRTLSVMCAPIISKGSIIGVLEVINRTNGEPFTDEDLTLLMRIVDQAALAVERVMLYQKLEELAITDDLTNLFNTRYLTRSIEAEIQRSKRYGTSVAVIFMDLDRFKDVNDTYGHLVGSKLLVEIGELLINQLRAIDVVARYGGDEFVIVLPQTSLKSALTSAERIREAMQMNTFLVPEGHNLKVTASFGVAAYPDTAKSKEELLRLADESMYSVKKRARNGVYAIM